MEGLALAKMLAALIFVVCLMFGFGLFLRKTGIAGPQVLDRTKRRLKFIEALPLDSKRRLVLVSCDEKQHLLVLGANSETVVDTDIPPVATQDESNDDEIHAKKSATKSKAGKHRAA